MLRITHNGIYWESRSKEVEQPVPPSADIHTRSVIPPTYTPPVSHVESADAVQSSDALSLAEVYRAVQILNTAVGQLSLDVYKGNKPVARVPLYIQKPDAKVSRSEWLKELVTSLALSGNAYFRVVRQNDADSTSPILALITLNPWDTNATLDQNGNVLSWSTSGVDRALRPHEVQHMRLLTVPGSQKGLGPIQAARADIFGALEVRKYGADFFNSADNPSGVLKANGPIDSARADVVKEKWDATKYGVRVLGENFSYSPLMVSPEDAQWLQSRNFSAVQIARLFGIPERLMMVSVNSETYANVQDADNAFLKYTVAAYTRVIEEALTDLVPRGQVVRFNFEAFLRLTTQARYESYSSAITNGWMTVDEVREIEGLEPLPQAEPEPVPVTEPEQDQEQQSD